MGRGGTACSALFNDTFGVADPGYLDLFVCKHDWEAGHHLCSTPTDVIWQFRSEVPVSRPRADSHAVPTPKSEGRREHSKSASGTCSTRALTGHPEAFDLTRSEREELRRSLGRENHLVAMLRRNLTGSLACG